MPRIFDNIDNALLPVLYESLTLAQRADFCVGYFNLRGWRYLADAIENWSGEEASQCRLLVGMPIDQDRQLRRQYALIPDPQVVDQSTVVRLRRDMAIKFKEQLTLGAPTDEDQEGLKQLSRQLKSNKVVVKLHLRYPLHAKLYMAHRQDPFNPIIAFMGSSNLTHAGLRMQGELNIDVLDHDATIKLNEWFLARWADKYSLDISAELAAIIDDSWVTERKPFHVYIKMAYHLSREARTGIERFGIPAAFRGKLFEYQESAVKIAAHHLDKRGGVLLGDVVGLGKTIMASAVARLYIEKHGAIPLIICPPNLMPMWQSYSDQYDLYAKVLSIGSVKRLKGEFSRHRLVIIDESHNLRNRESDRYAAVKEYIDDLQASVILLSATPYNKGYQDISSQLRLFVNESDNLGIRPDQYIQSIEGGEPEFRSRHQCPVHSIRAFEFSNVKEDWQQLMQRYTVRRTRTFIKRHYTQEDPESKRRYLLLSDGNRAYFPDRIPHTVHFPCDPGDTKDPYARLFSDQVVDLIRGMELPRYGLGNYLRPEAGEHASNKESQIIKDLGRAGKRLMGFCRTNLYKRLESCGESFLLSMERHILRNYLFAYALTNNLELPIGTQEPWMLDTGTADDDAEVTLESDRLSSPEIGENAISVPSETLFDELLDQHSLPFETAGPTNAEVIESRLRKAAKVHYDKIFSSFKNRFNWMRASLFDPRLLSALESDATQLISVLAKNPNWDPSLDRKLNMLVSLITQQHPQEKVLVFTQFADTAQYLAREIKNLGVTHLACVTGSSSSVIEIARRFSPVSNGQTSPLNPEDKIRVLIATDVLSEGQNLQDAHVVINFDLPWAIIRLVQRTGRVDRIGQQSPEIHCYSFVPMLGIDKIIQLRGKVRKRLKENAEVVGSDEVFFDDEADDTPLIDLYNEKAGILDGSEDDSEVDLQSRAYQIYKDAIAADSSLAKIIENLPDVVYSGKETNPVKIRPDFTLPAAIVYVRSPDDADALACIGTNGQSITENQSEILAMAQCEAQTPTATVASVHHSLVRSGVQHLMARERDSGGQLGRPSGARYRTYYVVKNYLEGNRGNILVPPDLGRALELILKFPLRQTATDALNRELRRGSVDASISDLVFELFSEGKLCLVEAEPEEQEPRIICSMGLI